MPWGLSGKVTGSRCTCWLVFRQLQGSNRKPWLQPGGHQYFWGFNSHHSTRKSFRYASMVTNTEKSHYFLFTCLVNCCRGFFSQPTWVCYSSVLMHGSTEKRDFCSRMKEGIHLFTHFMFNNLYFCFQFCSYGSAKQLDTRSQKVASALLSHNQMVGNWSTAFKLLFCLKVTDPSWE